MSGGLCASDYVKEQCEKWDEVVRLMYKACMHKAMVNDMWSSLTSMICIVLNVLIVGKKDLDLPDVAVSLFVVSNSVLKALAMQFAFASTASQLHAAKGGLREVLVKIQDRAIMGQHDAVSTSMLDSLRVEVQQSINAAPGWVSINPPSFRVPRIVPEIPDLGVGAAVGSLFGRKSPAKGNSEVHPLSIIPQGQGPAPVMLGPPQQRGAFDVQAPMISREVQQEPQHSMTPPQVEQEVLLPHLPPPPSPPIPPYDQRGGDVWHEVAANVQGALALSPEQQQAIVDVERRILEGFSESLEAAVSLSGKFRTFHSMATIFMSSSELILNSLIMLSSSVPAFHSESDSLVAVLAAVNAVLKGLQMKLNFEVKCQEVSNAFSKFKSLQERVRHDILDLDARNAPLPAAELADLKEAFRGLVSTYASWIPAVKQSKGRR